MNTIQVQSAEETFAVMRNCTADEPVLREVTAGHWAACHYVEGYDKSAVTRPILDHRRAVVPKMVEVIA